VEVNLREPHESHESTERLHLAVSFTIAWLVFAVIIPSFAMGLMEQHVRWFEYLTGFVGTFFVGGCMVNLVVLVRRERRLVQVVLAGVAAMVVSISFGIVRSIAFFNTLISADAKHLLRQFEVGLNGLAFIAFMYAFFHAVIDLLNTRQLLVDQQKCLLRDIKGRKFGEKQAQTVFRMALDGFLTTDSQGRILDVDDAYCQLSGYAREELLGMGVQDLDATEAPEEVLARIQGAGERGEDHFETRHRRKDGTTIDLDVSVLRTSADGGRQYLFLRNIAGRKAAVSGLKA
jgi:PAS domain S-box-containing protein